MAQQAEEFEAAVRTELGRLKELYLRFVMSPYEELRDLGEVLESIHDALEDAADMPTKAELEEEEVLEEEECRQLRVTEEIASAVKSVRVV